VDGKADPAYDELLNKEARNRYAALAFSPDSKHLAYAAKRNGKWVMVVDNKEGAEYDSIGLGSPAFSPDGKRMVYSALKSDKWSVVVDGQEGPGFETIFNPSFSPDGKHIAYVAWKKGLGRDWSLVVDGQPGAEHWAISNWAFSPDVKHLAYSAQMSEVHNPYGDPYMGGKWSIFFDGQAGAEYSMILPHTLVFDSNGTLEFLAVQKEGSSIGIEHHGSIYRIKYTPMP
jgi:Tol biopolymer transport system component